jgi:glycosyltransferase involved in cell wall biosynthesis
MKVAIITAGGAGMFCGSCMQDNTLARALRQAGVDVVLLPTYTPIRVDEADESQSRVFLGGINVWLDSKLPGWRFLPRWSRAWLDRPAVTGALARWFGGTDASSLGPLTIDMLRGTHGPQRSEIAALIDWLTGELQPDVIVFSNALLSGVVPELRRRYSGAIVCLLQGDDIFLNALPVDWRQHALDLIHSNAEGFDKLLTHSRFYSQSMQQMLRRPESQFATIPLLIEPPGTEAGTRFTIPDSAGDSSERRNVGYFARICPEKGIFNFLDAAERSLRRRDGLRFVMGGFLPAQHEPAFLRRLTEVRNLDPESIEYASSPPTRDEKFRLLQSFDWLCVPAPYAEPKGLFVLEAALAGVPALLPDHGAFPERLRLLEAGRLFTAGDASSLDAALQRIATEERPTAASRRQLHDNCLSHFGLAQGGSEIRGLLEQIARCRRS